MIFATCGTSLYPFDRMMAALGALPAGALCVQHGPATPPACAEAHPYMPFTDIAEHMAAADVVVTHAGVGSILSAIRAGHVPIVFPRLKRYGEGVDDHQAELAAVLDSRKAVLVVRTATELVDAVATVPARGTATQLAPQALVAAISASITRTPMRLASVVSAAE